MLKEDQTEFRANAIPEIREMFRSLETLNDPNNPTSHSSYNYFRLMRISEGINKGYILGTQHIDNQKILFKTDIYAAERRLLNIEASYEDEIKKLTLIKLQLLDVQKNLKNWNQIKDTSKIDDLKKILIECTDALKHVKNDDKNKLKEKIQECLTFQDSTGKKNPTIIRTKLRKAIKYIESRFEKIGYIHSYIGKDKAYVTSILESERLPMRKLINSIEKHKDDLLILKSPVKLSQIDRDRIINNLESVLDSFSNIRFQPNLAFCEKLKTQVEKVKDTLMGWNSSLDTKSQIKLSFTLI